VQQRVEGSIGIHTVRVCTVHSGSICGQCLSPAGPGADDRGTSRFLAQGAEVLARVGQVLGRAVDRSWHGRGWLGRDALDQPTHTRGRRTGERGGNGGEVRGGEDKAMGSGGLGELGEHGARVGGEHGLGGGQRGAGAPPAGVRVRGGVGDLAQQPDSA
jgi:hypothetical protein